LSLDILSLDILSFDILSFDILSFGILSFDILTALMADHGSWKHGLGCILGNGFKNSSGYTAEGYS
jgi:hypothetical protein